MFVDRRDAGRRLGQHVRALLRDGDIVVLGIPRGGVPVAAEVARALHAPLDVIVVRKLGVPWQPELALGAVGEGGVRVLNDEVVQRASVDADDLQALTEREWLEVERRAKEYRGVRLRESLVGRTAIVVDDGVATGATARAACQIASEHGAQRVVLAVPVTPLGWTRDFANVAEECIAVETPAELSAVGAHYRNFHPTSDAEVMQYLGLAAGVLPSL